MSDGKPMRPHLSYAEKMRTGVKSLEMEVAALRTRLAEVEAENERLRSALEPFADVGVWLFAIDAPDDTPLVRFRLINNAEGHLTRGMFKEAHRARAARVGACL